MLIRPDTALRIEEMYSQRSPRHGVTVKLVRVSDERRAMRRYDPERRVITLSEVLPPRSRRFQLAHQVALITQSQALDRVLRVQELGQDL